MYPDTDYYGLIGFCPVPHADRAPDDGTNDMGDVPSHLDDLRYDPDAHAMMLDFDGTLVNIAPTPDAVIFEDHDGVLLSRLAAKHQGAIAIVSGRAIDDLEHFMAEFPGAMAGGHGAELRINGKRRLADDVDQIKLEQLKESVRAFADSDPRLLIEDKTTGIVLHFRAHPDCEDKAHSFAEALVQGHEGFDVQHAKMAVEIRPDGASKAGAMEAILGEPQFAGRKPFFAGDDVTDEAAFEWVNAKGGISVKIGPEPTRAQYCTSTPRSFKAWLNRALVTASN
ncbi:MAG: trehalose-phosphatase [Pseudomonadota bacterium]